MAINKIELFEACMQQQINEVENFESRVDALKKEISTNSESASQSRKGDTNPRELLANYENELLFSQMEMTQLKSLDPSIANTVVEPGAIVMTEKLNFFISIPTDKMEINAQSFIGISTKAPIYASMQGKQKGDSFKFNDTEYTILNVF